jgi:1-acyl-sn-glycerol-3-phosphate acyltransferase
MTLIERIRVGFGLVAVVVATSLVALFQPIVLRTGLFPGRVIPRLWHRFALRVFGIRLRTTGRMAEGRPLLLVSNHISWTDIVILGASADLHFIAKADMIKWPVIGWLCTLQRTLFVDRSRPRQSGEQANEIGSRIAAGDPMVLFAEGTTSDGNLLLPFKSTLFGAASMAVAATPGKKVFIQPVAVAYTRLQGMPMGRQHRRHSAWIGDQDLIPHVVSLLREGAMDAELCFGEPIVFDTGSNRKQVARLIETQVRDMMASALRDPLPAKQGKERLLPATERS